MYPDCLVNPPPSQPRGNITKIKTKSEQFPCPPPARKFQGMRRTQQHPMCAQLYCGIGSGATVLGGIFDLEELRMQQGPLRRLACCRCGCRLGCHLSYGSGRMPGSTFGRGPGRRQSPCGNLALGTRRVKYSFDLLKNVCKPSDSTSTPPTPPSCPIQYHCIPPHNLEGHCQEMSWSRSQRRS